MTLNITKEAYTKLIQEDINFLRKNLPNKVQQSVVAWQAVELAELELKDKAQKAFCRQQCKIVCRESDYDNRCPDFEEFVAELNL